MNTQTHSRAPSALTHLRRFGLVSLLAIWACTSGSITFSPEEDDAIMSVLESTWATAGAEGLRLSLCEDRARADEWNAPGDCQEAHVVRGGGRGLAHKEDEAGGIGCGGCPFGVLAYVHGQISGGRFAEPVELTGEVNLGDLYDPNGIFGYPYRLNLPCADDSLAFSSIAGRLQENGQLELDIHLDQDWEPDHQETLPRQEDNPCWDE